MAGIAINGKFLGAGLNGVHRTAAHYSRALIDHASAQVPIRLLTPPGNQPNADFLDLAGEPVSGRFGRGQGWEMITLPHAAKDELLVNFCNLAPLLHRRSIVMIHDAQTFLYPEDFTGRQAVFYRLLLPQIARAALRILTVSEFARGSLAAHGIGHPGKIDVVHNGTDHILEEQADAGVLARHGLVAQGYVLVLGSAKGYKNMRAVFEALREPLASGQKLVVAGGAGPEAYRAKGWEPPAGTTFTGFVSDAELRALYEGAALFAFPSLTEGFGLPPVEAMHCGAPVVAARAGAMPEVLGDAALLVAADQPGEYRGAIEQVLADEDLANRLRADGRKRSAELSWKAAGKRLWSLVAPHIG